jgi:hypothetical protein
MTDPASPPAEPVPPADDAARFDVRSVTGACYTLVVDDEVREGVVERSYRTAYARLPVVANEDGSFTIVDTRTRLVRVAPR